jgi:hypothetical protein
MGKTSSEIAAKPTLPWRLAENFASGTSSLATFFEPWDGNCQSCRLRKYLSAED